VVEEIDRLPRLPPRRPDAHKGDFGHVLVVAGSPGMTGAACMAAQSAQMAGAGLVTLALPESLNLVAEVKLTSAMSMPLPQTEGGALGAQAAERLLEAADRFDVVAIGPGLGRAPETQEMVRRLLAELSQPLVLDADGLNAVAGHLEVLKGRRSLTVLSPHPGEMMRLCGASSVQQVQQDRRQLAAEFARDHSVLLVLKGHNTVVTDGERLYVNRTGNPGMATGGTGDVLTGLMAGLLCQGIGHFDAVQLAVFAHGLAGDLAALAKGELSMTAEHVLEQVPEAFKSAQEAAFGSAEGKASSAVESAEEQGH